MSENAPEFDELLSRVGRLEKENRRFKRGSLVLLAAAVTIGLMAQTKPQTSSSQKPKAAARPAAKPAEPPPPGPVVATSVTATAVEAQSFVLKDANGHVRAELAMMGSGPSLKFRDENGSALVTLSLNDKPAGPLLLLSDPQHHASVALSVLENAGPQLSLAGERPDIQLRMGVSPDGTTLELSDKDGFMTKHRLGVLPKNGQVRKTSAASIALFGKRPQSAVVSAVRLRRKPGKRTEKNDQAKKIPSYRVLPRMGSKMGSRKWRRQNRLVKWEWLGAASV